MTSSIAGSEPLAGFHIYGATKAFETFLAEGTHWEFKDTIDAISFRPGLTTTNILENMSMNTPQSPLQRSTEEVVNMCLS